MIKYYTGADVVTAQYADTDIYSRHRSSNSYTIIYYSHILYAVLYTIIKCTHV